MVPTTTGKQPATNRERSPKPYQFLDTTWNGYGGYAHAADAPPDIQDAKATEHVNAILDRNGGDVTAVPVVWYIGHVPAIDSTEWDTIPLPQAGNRLTPSEYQTKWTTAYHRHLDSTPPTTSGNTVPTPAPMPAPGGCVGGNIDPLPGGWSLPGPRALIDANPSALVKRIQPHTSVWPLVAPLPRKPVFAGACAQFRRLNVLYVDRTC